MTYKIHTSIYPTIDPIPDYYDPIDGIYKGLAGSLVPAEARLELYYQIECKQIKNSFKETIQYAVCNLSIEIIEKLWNEAWVEIVMEM